MSHVAKSIRVLITTMVVCLTAHEPATAADPVSVEVGIFVIDISKLNDVSQTFRTDFHLSARWHDAQLAEPDTDEIRRLELSDIWHPQLDVRNRRNVEFLFPMEVEVDRLGNVHYRQRISGNLSPLWPRRENVPRSSSHCQDVWTVAHRDDLNGENLTVERELTQVEARR